MSKFYTDEEELFIKLAKALERAFGENLLGDPAKKSFIQLPTQSPDRVILIRHGAIEKHTGWHGEDVIQVPYRLFAEINYCTYKLDVVLAKHLEDYTGIHPFRSWLDISINGRRVSRVQL